VSWLPDLLKHLTVSKTVAGALFLATTALLALPKFFPDQVSAVPDQWRWLVAGLAFFSGALLCLWGASAAARALARAPAALRQALPERELEPLEAMFIELVGRHSPNESISLNDLDQSKVSKLEMFQMCKGLQARGFLTLNDYYPEIVGLTDKGRAKALALIKAKA
jgi:hypothetical protein